MIEAIRNALTLPDLRRKIFFTLLILVAYRAAAHVPVPGVDTQALQNFLESGDTGSTIVQFLNLLSGGALANFSVKSSVIIKALLSPSPRLPSM